MANEMNPYQRRGSRLPTLTKNESHGLQEPSPVTGNIINWEMKVLPSAQIHERTIKSQYNKRSQRHLTRAAVNDILPEITKLKRNTQYVKAVINGDKLEILEGIRRTTAVSYVADGELYMLVAKELSEEEKRHYAQMSDVYREPTQLDIGYSALDIRKQYTERNETIRDYKLAEIFCISTGKMSEAIASASLPDELISLFPALEFVQVRFLRQIIAWIRVNHIDKLLEVVSKFEPLSETDDDIQQQSINLQKHIIKALSDAISKPVEYTKTSEAFRDLSVRPGICVAVKQKGEVVVTFKTEEMDEVYLSALRDLIAQADH